MTGSVDTPAGARGWLTPTNIALFGATLLTLVAAGGWLANRLMHVHVLDARISADMILMSSQVAGPVVELPAREAAPVATGELLVQIDPRYAELAVAELQATLAALDATLAAEQARLTLVDRRTSTHLEVTRTRLDSAAAALEAARARLEMASADWQRAGPLLEQNVLTQQQWEADRNAWLVAGQEVRRLEAQLTSARAEVAEAEAERAELDVLKHSLQRLRAERERAATALQRARRELADHSVRSPVDALVDEIFVDPGEYVAAGQRLLILHNPDDLWVKANVKETDLRHFEIGKPVEVSVDALPGVEFAGRVSRIGSAATSQFALLPSTSPAGNFTKITQRIEVTVQLDETDPRLRPGMLVELRLRK